MIGVGILNEAKRIFENGLSSQIGEILSKIESLVPEQVNRFQNFFHIDEHDTFFPVKNHLILAESIDFSPVRV